ERLLLPGFLHADVRADPSSGEDRPLKEEPAAPKLARGVQAAQVIAAPAEAAENVKPRKEIRLGDADARCRRGQLPLSASKVGPARKQVGGQHLGYLRRRGRKSARRSQLRKQQLWRDPEQNADAKCRLMPEDFQRRTLGCRRFHQALGAADVEL